MIKKNQLNVKKFLNILCQMYPNDTQTQLKYKSAYQLLIATILSAQTTDKQVNKITGKLFKEFKTPMDFAQANQKKLENLIKSCGLYKNKSRNIINTSKLLVEKYDSKVPDNINDLLKLPGVGRKTANVLLNILYGMPTIPVDTHVFRVSRRLGLASGNTPEKVEKELLDIIPPSERGDFHHRIITHGRKICISRSPRCHDCKLNKICISTVYQEV